MLKLSEWSDQAYRDVIQSLRNADLLILGNTISHLDYRNLMEKIISECHDRKMNSYDVEAIQDAAEENIG